MARAGLSHFSSNFSYRVYTRLDLLHLPPNRVSMYRFTLALSANRNRQRKLALIFMSLMLSKLCDRKRDVQFVMMTVHGKKLVKTFPLTAKL